MNPKRAICAGFRDDVFATLRESGDTEPLADVLPFVSACGPEFEGLLVAALDAAALRFGQPVPLAVLGEGVAVTPRIRARQLLPIAVALLARHDDLALGALYRAVVARKGLAKVDAPLADVLRALVVQCRASLADNWEVFLLDETQA